MTPEQHSRLMALFDSVCELPKRELAAFLASLPAEDQPLRPQLEAMVEADGHSHVFFDQTRGGVVAIALDMLDTSSLRGQPDNAQSDALPTHIGEYEIIERLGAGGMGSVYKARQTSPARIVALKTLHPWLVSATSIERFRFESQALASLKHPSIPPVYTVGQHQGAVYFAMELVHGPALMTWVKAQARSVTDILNVLVRICDAVHHAHLRGFVHRDLKPDNIRVTDDTTPQVLDFGISAGLGSQSAEVAGTPVYMSPEQLDPAAPVDVRTDVFSLGVIAFEMLSGEVPMQPPKSGLATLQAAKNRPAPRLLTKAKGLGSELDAIVAKALEVNPEHRYASVAELGSDLRRFLHREPVHAYSGGSVYRFTRFVQRNRLFVGATAGVLIALATGVGVASSQYIKAEKARKTAATEAERASASLQFLTTVLQEADADNAGGRGATIGDALDNATKKLEAEHVDPHVESSLRASLANTYVGLGEWAHASEQAALALSAYEKNHLDDDEQLGEVLRVVSEVRIEAGDTVGSVEAADRGLEVEERIHGKNVPHAHTSYSLHNAAIAHRENAKFEKAVQLHLRAIAMERVLARSTQTDDLGDTLDQYGVTLVAMGRWAEALAAHTETLNLNLAKYGPDHLNTGISNHHIAWLEVQRNRPAEALVWLEKALKVRLPLLGPDHMRIGMQRNAEALAHLELGNIDKADWAIGDCLRIAKRSFGNEYGRYAQLEGAQVLVFLAQKRFDEALALSQALVARTAQRYRPTHAQMLEARSNHGLALLRAGRRDEAITELRAVNSMMEQLFGANTPAMLRLARERLAEAQSP